MVTKDRKTTHKTEALHNAQLSSLIRLLYRAFYDDKADFWRIMMKLKKYVGKHYKEYS